MDETWVQHYDPETKKCQKSEDILVVDPKISRAVGLLQSPRLHFLG
jgi:hypothetical protein